MAIRVQTHTKKLFRIFVFYHNISIKEKPFFRARAEKGIAPSARVMQIDFDTSDNCVNILIEADFNLLSRGIQGDTQRFELMERFIKVRNLL